MLTLVIRVASPAVFGDQADYEKARSMERAFSGSDDDERAAGSV